MRLTIFVYMIYIGIAWGGRILPKLPKHFRIPKKREESWCKVENIKQCAISSPIKMKVDPNFMLDCNYCILNNRPKEAVYRGGRRK